MTTPESRWPDGLLPPDLEEALRDRPRPAAVKSLFLFCHAMATAYVRTKVARGSFHPSRLGVNAEDFALDAIAELFRLDRGGRLDAFKELLPFCQNGTDSLTLHHQLRRIVFGAVNQQIFRSFHQSDPTLARLIRNIKETVARMKHARSFRWQESLMVSPLMDDLHMDRPPIPQELLQIEFANRSSRGFSLREHLGCIIEILQAQTLYRKAYPVTGLALLIRPLLTDSGGDLDLCMPWNDSISESEVEQSIYEVVNEISNTLFDSYLTAGKLDNHESNAYREALREVLVMIYVHGDENGMSYFSVLSKHLGPCEKDEYMVKHRARFEYTVKMAKMALQKRWTGELGFSASPPDRDDTSEKRA
jgi:hypothetical protein